jgi:hypothetical protein
MLGPMKLTLTLAARKRNGG